MLRIQDVAGAAVRQKDVSVPVFDSTALHVAAAVRYSLGER